MAYRAKSSIRHNGEYYEAGQDIGLSEEEATTLIEQGIVELVEAEEGKTKPAARNKKPADTNTQDPSSADPATQAPAEEEIPADNTPTPATDAPQADAGGVPTAAPLAPSSDESDQGVSISVKSGAAPASPTPEQIAADVAATETRPAA